MTAAALSEQIGNCLILLFVVGIPLYAHFRKIPVYDTFIEGAKEGFPTLIKLIPYLVGMLVAIGMLRASGTFDLLAQLLAPLLMKVGIPAEIVPIAIIRPFSSSAATAAVAELLHTQGGDSYLSHVAAIVAGTTETTFYVVAVYFGAANIRNTRHAIPTSIIVDITGILAAVWIARWLLQ
jgi:spore maturation protein B